MARGIKSDEPLEKITVRVFKRDIELARQYFPAAGYNQILRAILHSTILTLERRREGQVSSPSQISLEAREDIATDTLKELNE